MTHYFKRTTKKAKGLTIFRCERCDSECLFNPKRTDAEVNDLVSKIFIAFPCINKQN